MSLTVHTDWKSGVTSDLDREAAHIILRAHMQGTVLAHNGETAERIRTSGAIPRDGSPFPDNTSLIAVHVECNAIGPNTFEWSADYEWKTPDYGGGNIDRGNLPERWTFRRMSSKSSHAVDQDADGWPIMTITGESPNPPLTDDISDTGWVFSTTGRPWREDILYLFEDATNSDPFLNASPGQCKIHDIQASVSFSQDRPPEMECSVTVLVGKPPPEGKMYQRTDSGAWTTATQPAAFYTWWKRWRAEGYRYIPAGDSVRDAHGQGETPVLRLHHPVDGTLITTATQARWYVQRRKPMLPFAILFNSI